MSTKRPPRLTARQRRFVEEYAIHLNATKAAAKAGYSAQTARQMGAENLSKPFINEKIHAQQEAASEAAKVSAAKVVDSLNRLVKADMADLFRKDGSIKPVTHWPEEFRSVLVKNMTVKVSRGNADIEIISIEFVDRTTLLQLLGRAVGAWR